MRAFLFATATMTSIGGLRASIWPSHESAGTPLRSAQRTTALAAMMSRRRSVRSPMREVRPRRSLPPVERCTGVSPTQAAKSRPERNVSTGGAKASMAVAISGPIPGTLISRRAVSSAFARGDLGIERCGLFLQMAERMHENGEAGTSGWRNVRFGILDLRDQPLDVGGSLRRDQAVLGKMAADRVDELSTLADQHIASPEDHRGGLLGFALHANEAHGRTLRGLANRLGIGRVVLLALNEGLHVGRRDQLDRVAELADLAAPMIRAGAGLHRHEAGWLGRKEGEYLITP